MKACVGAGWIVRGSGSDEAPLYYGTSKLDVPSRTVLYCLHVSRAVVYRRPSAASLDVVTTVVSGSMVVCTTYWVGQAWHVGGDQVLEYSVSSLPCFLMCGWRRLSVKACRHVCRCMLLC